MISRIGLAAAALVFSLVSASAAPLLYECDMNEKHRNQGWVADKIVFVVGDDGKVTVIDPVIQHFGQDPMIAKVIRSNDKTLKVRWVLRDTTTATNQRTPRLDYDATINKKTNRIAVSAKPHGFPNRHSGKGSCKVRTN